MYNLVQFDGVFSTLGRLGPTDTARRADGDSANNLLTAAKYPSYFYFNINSHVTLMWSLLKRFYGFLFVVVWQSKTREIMITESFYPVVPSVSREHLNTDSDRK